MFEDFFQKCEIRDPEKITTAQSDKIRATLQSKLAADNSQPQISTEEKEKNTMKTKAIRTIIIAAAVAVVGLGGVVGASALGAFRTSEEIAADLADKNKVTPEFAEYAEDVGKEKEDAFISPSYEDMGVINELVVKEIAPADYKGWEDEDFPGIILRHIDVGHGGVETMIKSDGSGGYLYDGELITDEKILAAIAEGTEKYGDTFVIQY